MRRRVTEGVCGGRCGAFRLSCDGPQSPPPVLVSPAFPVSPCGRRRSGSPVVAPHDITAQPPCPHLSPVALSPSLAARSLQ